MVATYGGYYYSLYAYIVDILRYLRYYIFVQQFFNIYDQMPLNYNNNIKKGHTYKINYSTHN